MKKVLIFSLSYYPKFVGGAEVAIKEITDRIPDIEFHVITHRFDSSMLSEERIGNVLVHRVGQGGREVSVAASYGARFFLAKALFVPLATLKALSLHKRHHYDAAWAMMAYMLFPLALLRLFRMKIPYALTLQEGDPFERVFNRPHILPFRPLLSIGFRNAFVVQSISTYLGAWSRKVGFKGPLEIIPNGVDVVSFAKKYSDMEVNGTKDALAKKLGEVFLITTSRLVSKNAVDNVIQALASLPEHVRFIVLGTGPEETKLKKLTSSLRLGARVAFLGHVDHKEMPLYLHASDIFVRPSRSEGMGNSFIEAMAAGLPVIATQEGGIADFLFDEKRNPDKPVTGWAVDTDSPEQIAAAVKDIMAHPEKMRAVVATARAMVKEKYDWDMIARDMRTKVFEKLFRERHI